MVAEKEKVSELADMIEKIYDLLKDDPDYQPQGDKTREEVIMEEATQRAMQHERNNQALGMLNKTSLSKFTDFLEKAPRRRKLPLESLINQLKGTNRGKKVADKSAIVDNILYYYEADGLREARRELQGEEGHGDAVEALNQALRPLTETVERPQVGFSDAPEAYRRIEVNPRTKILMTLYDHNKIDGHIMPNWDDAHQHDVRTLKNFLDSGEQAEELQRLSDRISDFERQIRLLNDARSNENLYKNRGHKLFGRDADSSRLKEDRMIRQLFETGYIGYMLAQGIARENLNPNHDPRDSTSIHEQLREASNELVEFLRPIQLPDDWYDQYREYYAGDEGELNAQWRSWYPRPVPKAADDLTEEEQEAQQKLVDSYVNTSQGYRKRRSGVYSDYKERYGRSVPTTESSSQHQQAFKKLMAQSPRQGMKLLEAHANLSEDQYKKFSDLKDSHKYNAARMIAEGLEESDNPKVLVNQVLQQGLNIGINNEAGELKRSKKPNKAF